MDCETDYHFAIVVLETKSGAEKGEHPAAIGAGEAGRFRSIPRMRNGSAFVFPIHFSVSLQWHTESETLGLFGRPDVAKMV